MRHLRLLTIILLSALAFFSCQRSQLPTIQKALQTAYTAPDSALSLLNDIHLSSLPNDEKPMYALTYYLAQNKSGLDVADDSLIRIAYNHYKKCPEDSLYGRCMYYMGFYYALTDSLARANYCLKEAARNAEARKDTATLCLALSKNSWVTRKSDAQSGLKYASQAVELYRKYSKATPQNTIYYILLKCESERLCGHSRDALHSCKTAETMALQLGDSLVLADVYQDMSLFAADLHDTSAVRYARLACQLSQVRIISKQLMLAQAYLDTGKPKDCLKLLDTLQLENNAQCYTAYSCQHQAALQLHDFTTATAYADSAYKYLETMYCEQLQDKTTYFEKLMQEKTAKAQAETRASRYRLIFLFGWILAFLVTTIMFMRYRNYKSKTALKLKYEKEIAKERIAQEQEKTKILQAQEQEKRQLINELNAKEKEMTEKLHQEQLRHKDAQIAQMRQFFIKKIDFLQRHYAQNEEGSKCLHLEETDWEEIELFLENTDNKFVSRLKDSFPTLSTKDIRLLTLVRLNLPAKTLARIYCISEKSVKQNLFLFKGKLGIQQGKDSLRKFIEEF